MESNVTYVVLKEIRINYLKKKLFLNIQSVIGFFPKRTKICRYASKFMVDLLMVFNNKPILPLLLLNQKNTLLIHENFHKGAVFN